ncbi:MAG: hypothetical protein FJ096_05485 [Deltaproteobacteria bacterium]|nr:hypothetical protein [Deltaproteobacteria bacterium]
MAIASRKGRFIATLLPLLALSGGCGSSSGPNAGLCPATDDPTLWTAGTLHSGAIDAAETWTAAASPHRVLGTLDVNAVLTVDPCAVVLLAPTEGGGATHLDLHEGGKLVAEGSADKPILIRGLKRADGSAE